MPDYEAILKRSIETLPEKTPDMRQAVYKRARAALARQLISVDPPLRPESFESQRQNLEDAILTVEIPYQSAIPNYADILKRSIETLREKTPDMRQAVYERARSALARQLISVDPPVRPESIELQNQRLEDAIKAVELDESKPPELPIKRLGAHFHETAQNLVEIAPTGQPSEADDVAALERARNDIFDALDDLDAAIGQSNAFQFVRPIAEKYRAGLEGPIADVAFDTVWRRGVRLRAVHVRIQREIEAGELPEPAMDLEEALSSLVAFHGPMVLSTEAGRQQADLVREDRGEIDEWMKNTDKLIDFARRARAQPAFLAPESGEEIEEQAAIAGEGPDQARSIEASVALEESLLVWLGNRISRELATSPIGVGAGTVVLAQGFSPVVGAGVSFLLANADFLIGFSACSSEYLYWIPEYLTWLKRRMGLIA